MDTYQIFPSFAEFYELIAFPGFDKSEIDFQKKCAKEVGFKDFDEYLRFYYDLLSLGLSDKNLREQFVPQINDLIEGKTEYMPPLNLIWPKVVKTNIMQVHIEKIKAAEKFSASTRKRVVLFENKMLKNIMALIFYKNKKVPAVLDVIFLIIKKAYNQFKNFEPSLAEHSNEMNEYVESLRNTEISQKIKKHITGFLYFNIKSSLFSKLYQELLKHKVINKNKNFISSFEFEVPKPNEVTLWNGIILPNVRTEFSSKIVCF